MLRSRVQVSPTLQRPSLPGRLFFAEVQAERPRRDVLTDRRARQDLSHATRGLPQQAGFFYSSRAPASIAWEVDFSSPTYFSKGGARKRDQTLTEAREASERGVERLSGWITGFRQQENRKEHHAKHDAPGKGLALKQPRNKDHHHSAHYGGDNGTNQAAAG